jgi:DNA repair exonuclease SbcCD ATPase subunit
MNKGKSIAWAAIAGFLLASSGARASETPDSEQVSKLLSEAKTMSYQLKEDAIQMETFTRNSVSWKSHADAISQIRDHLNALGKQAQKLKEAKSTASPWQKTAIDRIEPYLDELVGYITAAIEHVNQNKHNMVEYNDYLEANADYASDLANMIGSFVDYGKTRQRLDRLAARLEVPESR